MIKKDGGSLIYTSVKNHTNLTILYEYILHYAYGVPFRFEPEIMDE